MSLKLPVKEISVFIKAAKDWLGGRTESKKSFEVRFSNHNNKLHLSAGADSAYMEAMIDVDASLIQNSFFLDLDYFGQYDFQTDKLTLIVPDLSGPKNNSTPRQVQFKATGANFRIPLKSGEVWSRNNQNLDQLEESPGLVMSYDFINKVFPLWKLPDSFNLKNRSMVKIEREGDSISTYYFDGYGAFWHTLSSLDISFRKEFKSAYILYDFLSPYKKMGEFVNLEIQQSSRQTVCSVTFDPKVSKFYSFKWVEPNVHKDCPNVPKILATKRSGINSCLVFDSKSFLANVKKSVTFFSKEQQRKEPISLNMIGNQYNLKGVLENSEMIVEGEAKQGVSQGELSVQFQSGCLMDYLQCLDLTHDVNVEILDSTTVLYQKGSDESLLYWMPTQKSRNMVNNN